MKLTICESLLNISPLQGLFLTFPMISTNIWAALPLKEAAEQQDICSSEAITRMCQSCISSEILNK
jgi:hypothetical protein